MCYAVFSIEALRILARACYAAVKGPALHACIKSKREYRKRTFQRASELSLDYDAWASASGCLPFHYSNINVLQRIFSTFQRIEF